MRQSRYVWLLGISLFCLISIIALKTPQTVISTMADPQYGNSTRTTVQHFWKLMDLRQTDLARDLLKLPEGSLDESEFKAWETRLNKNPMLSLQKVEFMTSDLGISQGVVVRVFWTSPDQGVQHVTFSNDLIQTEKGWRIQRIKRINDL
ncbi:hypothetical protein [Desulfosporosinus sp. Sb-LF]|uniref:hypothetical protein n=1 Tax=Desulfosporosinus sp. Sb-LF TaxID=2560027 RepID=UPI00107FB6D0|nr:hypothetical protein [Desulfosporosinus sp. Sb-LF]TGE32345.1 hypothetical protein E4K68_12120 [Desulfosporosinus sp. Sb-LF]